MATIHQPLIHDTHSPCAGKDESVKIEIATLGLQLNPSADNNAGFRSRLQPILEQCRDRRIRDMWRR